MMPLTDSSDVRISIKQETLASNEEIKIEFKPGFRPQTYLTKPNQDHSLLRDQTMDDKSDFEDEILSVNDTK